MKLLVDDHGCPEGRIAELALCEAAAAKHDDPASPAGAGQDAGRPAEGVAVAVEDEERAQVALCGDAHLVEPRLESPSRSVAEIGEELAAARVGEITQRSGDGPRGPPLEAAAAGSDETDVGSAIGGKIGRRCGAREQEPCEQKLWAAPSSLHDS